MSEQSDPKATLDPRLAAALSVLLTEIGKEPVPARIRELSAELQRALKEHGSVES